MRTTLPLLAFVGACGAAPLPPPSSLPPPAPVVPTVRPFVRTEADLAGRVPSSGALVFARPGRGMIVDVDVSPDGSFVVVSTDDGTVALVDARTGETRGHRRVAIRGERYLDVRIDASSTYVTVQGFQGDTSGRVETWDLVSDTWTARVAEGPTDEPIDRRGERVLDARSDGTVVVLDARDRNELVHLDGHRTDARMRASFGSDGTCILAQATLDTVALHRASDGALVTTIDAGMPSDAVDAIEDCRSAYVPRADGGFVHVRTEDGVAPIAEAHDADGRVAEPTGPSELLGERIAVAADGSRAAVAVRDVLRIHDLRAAASVQVAPGAGERSVWNLAYSPSGDRLFFAGRGFVLEASASGVRALECEGPTNFARLPDGTPYTHREDEACFADHRFRSDEAETFLAVSSDGNTALFARGDAIVERSASGELTLFTFTGGTCDPYAGCGYAAAYAPDGHYVVVQRGRAIRIVDRTRRRVARARDAEEGVTALTFSADGRSLVLPSSTGYALVGLANGRAVRFSAGMGATFLPDGAVARFVFARGRGRGGRGDTEFLVVEAMTGRVVRRFTSTSGMPTLTATFAAHRFGIRGDAAVWYDADGDVAVELPAGSTIAGYDRDGSVLALCESGRLVVRHVEGGALGGPRDVGGCEGVGAIAVRDDGRDLSLVRGATVELVDVEGGAPAVVLRMLPTAPSVPAFATTTDGRFEVSADAGAEVRARGPGPVWSAPLGDATSAPGRRSGLLGAHFPPAPSAAPARCAPPVPAHTGAPDGRNDWP